MKLALFLAATGIALATGTAPAHADRVIQTTRTVTTTHTATGPAFVGHRRHRVCRTIWRNHQRVRRCLYR